MRGVTRPIRRWLALRSSVQTSLHQPGAAHRTLPVRRRSIELSGGGAMRGAGVIGVPTETVDQQSAHPDHGYALDGFGSVDLHSCDYARYAAVNRGL